MERKYSKSYVTKVTVISFLCGLLFLLTGMFVGALCVDYAFTPTELIDMHRIMPIMYFFDLLPIALGVIGFFVAKHYSVQQTALRQKWQRQNERQERVQGFVRELCDGKTAAEFVPEQDDTLGQSVISLRDSISRSQIEEDARRNEDKQRGWEASGLALFGEILRANNDNVEELSYQVIYNLVKYVNANQGAFYLLEDFDKSDIHFRMTACYAYERKKYADKTIAWGDGLVGACALEKHIIHLKKVPDTFLEITSGLGKANPRNVILAPLKVNDEVHGVLEMASFNEFEKFQLDFIEKVTESIATTISTVKSNMITAKLLTESREQAEELAQKEEQMRQNMEELQATQEEATRQSEKFISFSNSVNHTMIRADINIAGDLVYANTKFLQKMEFNANSEVEGKPLSMFINKKDREWFDDIWQGLSKGGKHFEGDIKMLTKTGKDLWMMATFTCVRNATGGVDNVLFLAIDTTEKKKQSLDFEGQILALNRSNIKAEFSPTADIIDTNDRFLLNFGFPDLKNKNLFDIVANIDRSHVEKTWDDVIHGIPYEGQIRFMTKSNEEKWLHCTFTAVNDMYNELNKVIMIANDITRVKHMELETNEQNEKLKKQEEQLRQNEVELNRKIKEAREEVKNQFREIEKVKIRNEKTLDGFLDAIITTDHDGIVQFFNRAAEELFGVKREEILGQNVKLLFPDNEKGGNEFVESVLSSNKENFVGQRREINITTRTGEELQVLMLLSEAHVGREVTYTAFIQNISVDLF